MTMALIVCGGRNWTDRELIYERLDAFCDREPSLTLIEGAARGPDQIAGTWARRRGIDLIEMPANWKFHSKECPGAWCALKNFCLAAGPVRNQAMIERALEFERQFVLAFKDDFNLARDSGGTEDLVRRAIAAQIHGTTIRHALAATL